MPLYELFGSAGIVAIFAALIGGGLSAFGFTVPVITSPKRQALLGAFGAILLLGSIPLYELQGDGPPAKAALSGNNSSDNSPFPPPPRKKNFEKIITIDSGSGDNLLDVKLLFYNIRLTPQEDLAVVRITTPTIDEMMPLETGDTKYFLIDDCDTLSMLVMKISPDERDRKEHEKLLEETPNLTLPGSGKLTVKFTGTCLASRFPSKI